MSVSETKVSSNCQHRRIQWESFVIYLFQVNILRGSGEENCPSTRKINSIDKVDNRRRKGAG